MTSRQTLLDRDRFVEGLRHMGEDDLLYLNRMVAEQVMALEEALAGARAQIASLLQENARLRAELGTAT